VEDDFSAPFDEGGHAALENGGSWAFVGLKMKCVFVLWVVVWGMEPQRPGPGDGSLLGFELGRKITRCRLCTVEPSVRASVTRDELPS
jgi:hypothetical protein